jgi:hypothetical protein
MSMSWRYVGLIDVWYRIMGKTLEKWIDRTFRKSKRWRKKWEAPALILTLTIGAFLPRNT